ncbi:MAG: aspartate aminotransferase family protein [Clostridiales bacterium]|jgi:4-aminobutyrate aminotransferase-like enzyme|nr:aspartate aminotransferase family protein [Eubacteriales bacterium]MDH7566738.1 aspartate aminotransferase family protein [Clostridiales bacterium]
MYIGPEAIIEKKKQYLIPCTSHFYKNPPQMVRGSMQYLFDHQGKRYLDCFAGVSVVSCGHCNPEIVQKTVEQMQTLQHTTSIYLNQPVVELAEKLAEVLPGDIDHSFFCTSGSEANEGALLLAKLYTGRDEFIALKNGLHGRTHLTMGLTGLDMWRASPVPAAGTHIAQNPYPDFSKGEEDIEESGRKSLEDIGRILQERKGKIAALIAEPIQGNGGILTPPRGYFRALKKLLEDHGALLIIDEIQTGFGRTGKMFAIEHFGVVPDIITVAKALGNGIPISAFAAGAEIAAAFTRPSSSTFGGNPVASATAMAVLEYIQSRGLAARAEELGRQLSRGLAELKQKYPIIRDVRGMGLMQGAELLRENGEPAAEETDIVLEKMKDAGVLVGKNGRYRNVLAFQPPLVITGEDIRDMLLKLDEVLGSL